VLADGRGLAETFDVDVQAVDLDAQKNRLAAKYGRLAEPVIGRDRAAQTAGLVMALDGADDVLTLMAQVR